MAQEKNNFDGEIVVIADREIIGRNSIDFLVRRNGGGGVSRNHDFARLLSGKGNVERFGHVFEADFGSLRRSLERKCGKEIVDVLLDGKVRVNLLLDTMGGWMVEPDLMRKMAFFVAEHGGEVNSWATEDAQSAGALMFEVGQSRYALGSSRFCWHNSAPPWGTMNNGRFRATDQWVVEREIAEMVDFFRANANAASFPAIKEKIDRAVANFCNTDNAVFFRGRELHKAGVVTEVFSSVSDMNLRFSHLMPENPLVRNKVVRGFWNRQIQKEFTRKRSGE